MIRIWLGATCAIMLSIGTVSAESLDGTETYDLLFREGTLNSVDPDATLVYRRAITNNLRPENGDQRSGDIALHLDDEDGMALLELRQGENARTMGRFPASVGNPMIMVFYESVIRDMAESAGGSPYYIRNRVKEALIQPSKLEAGTAMVNGAEVATQTIRLRPFDGDPNANRMLGFGSLEMTVTMSEDVPGWYVSLVAEAGTDDAPVYLSDMQFISLETGE